MHLFLSHHDRRVRPLRARFRSDLASIVLAVLIGTFALGFLLAPSAHAASVSGRAFVGGSWMVGGQSYFSVSILGHSTTGWCMNRGAAEPLSGWYSYRATRTESGAGGSAEVWLDGSFEPASYDAATNTSRTQAVTFRAGTSNAAWNVSVPHGCTLLVDGTTHPAGSTARVLPGQSVRLIASDPASLGGDAGTVTLAGTAWADASTTVTYRNITITPPGAWDGHSYHNGLPSGYQRIGVGPITVHKPATCERWLSASVRLALTVRYYVDGEEHPCWSERIPANSVLTSSDAAWSAGSKPDCTPGLDAWYHDRSCQARMVPFTPTADVDLHGRNLATVSFAPALSSALQFETSARDAPAETSGSVSLESLLPDSRIAAWGTNATLESLSVDILYFHDGERWRTLRRPDEGWHREESALDETVSVVRVERDTVLYDYWTRSTYDGVLDW